MKNNSKFYLIIVALFLSAICVAQPKGYKKSSTGLLYKMHTDKPGRLAINGDIIRLHFAMKTDKDSIIRSTFNEPTPIEMPLQDGMFKGSVEDGLKLLSQGDSATFLIQADSLFTKMFRMPLPPFIKSGSFVGFDIKIINVMTKEEYRQEQEKKSLELASKEIQTIEEYISKNKLTATKTASWLYIVQKQPGTGAKAEKNKTVSVHYTGTLLNGNKFDSSVDRGTPFDFVLGQGQVIQGWDEGIALMSVGEKATLIIPSRMAYGQSSPSPAIPPNSVLVFDVELIGIK